MLWQTYHSWDTGSCIHTASAAGAAVVTVFAGLWLLKHLREAMQQAMGMSFEGTVYLQQQRQRHGDAFCIGGVGARLVFLSDPAAIQLFFTAPASDFEFKAAVEHFTKRVFLLDTSGTLLLRHSHCAQGLGVEILPRAGKALCFTDNVLKGAIYSLELRSWEGFVL